MKSIKLTFALLALAMVTTLISCKNTKEVEYTEPIDIEVSLYKGKYFNAETGFYRVGDRLNMSLDRKETRRGTQYMLYLAKDIDALAEYTETPPKPARVWIDFTDGSSEFFEHNVYISNRGFESLLIFIEPAIYDGKRIKEIIVREIREDGGENRSWVLEINAEHSIGKVLNDMLEAVNEFKETQEKYK
tara:strand:- start:262 stop:828 length:567 start_codon:yes stop_codon:yes gene_type:complete